MTYDLAPEEPPAVPPDSDLPLPGRPQVKKPKKNIDHDVQCVRCGYNLRGLTRTHRCPECGTPALATLAGQSLLHAPADWLRQVKNGLAMILGSVGVDIAAIINIIAGSTFGHALQMLSAALAFGGVFLLTAPEPRLNTAESGMTLRKYIRVAALAWLVCAATAALSPFAKLAAMAQLGGVGLSVAIMLGIAAYLRSFAARIPDSDLERSTSNVLWGLAVSTAFFLFFGGFTALFATMPRILGPGACIATLSGGMTCLFAGWLMLLLYRYYETIRWAAHDAERRFKG